MSNSVHTDFTANASPLFKTVDAAKSKLTTFSGDIDKLSDRSKSLQKDFSSLAAQRLDGGNASHLTKEIVRASERSRQLQADVRNIQKELANPNRKSSIGFLTDELKAAEREADSLNRKLDRVNAKDTTAGQTAGRGGRSSSGGRASGRRGGYSEGLLTGLELVDDFAPAGLNRPFNAAVKGLVSIGSLSGTALLGLGAVAAAGVGLVKISQNIREEAERRLRYEEQIAGAINRQISGQREALTNFKELRAEAERSREFTRGLQTKAIDELKGQRSFIEKLQSITPAVLPVIENGKLASKANPVFEKQTQDILALDARIDEFSRQKNAAAAKASDERFESFQKNQEKNRQAAIEAEKKFEADRKKREEDFEKAKEKIRDLGKQYNSVFDSLLSRQNAENPIAAVFSEGRRELESLKESLRGLSPELQAQAAALQKRLNDNALFSARLDNKLGGLDLRDEADSFRSFKQPGIKDAAKFFEDFISAGLKQISNDTGGTNRRFNRLATGGFSQSDARNDLLYSFDRVSNRDGSFGGFSRRARTFADLTQREKDDFIRSSSDPDGNNLKFQQRLDRQVLAANNSGALTDDQRRIVDRKLISLTNGVDPSRLTDNQRDVAAAAREREALRLDQNEAKAQIEREKQTALQTRIAVSNEKLIEIAEKGGSSAIEVLLKNESNGAAEMRANNAKRPVPADTNLAFGVPPSRSSRGFTNR